MIVRTLPDRIQLITQPDHAQLARRIMEHCVPLGARSRRDTILLAIGEHDNGWAEEDAEPAVGPASGRITDFISAPLAVRHRVWPRAVGRLAGAPWAAALVAQHAITVYSRFRQELEWTPFFDEMTAARDAMLRAGDGSLDDLVADYAFVRLGDLISLVFCTDGMDEQRFDDWTVRRSGSHVLVVPDLFGGATIPVEITTQEIENRPLRSNAELRDALSHARIVTLRGRVSA